MKTIITYIVLLLLILLALVQVTLAQSKTVADRFLFGTDVVAPPDEEFYLAVFKMYEPLWRELSQETSEKIRLGNYLRIFEQARKKVREWENASIK